MRIVVCVKLVPDPSSQSRISPETFRLDRSGEMVPNALDLHAVEEAVRLRKAGGAEPDRYSEVTLVSMAPAVAAAGLRTPLAMGADRAVVISDAGLAGSDLLVTSRVLAAVVERETADLILFGQQAFDSNGALLWAALANRLRLPVISRAVALELVAGRVRAERRTESSQDTVESPLPCVISVSSAINEPRIPTFRQLKAAGARPTEVLSLAELGLAPADAGDAASRTEVYALREPEARDTAERIVDGGDAAKQILEYLVARRVL